MCVIDRLMTVFWFGSGLSCSLQQVAFMTAGYPTREDVVPLLLALQAGGADVVELGVPFTDPQADGTTIQKASEVGFRGLGCGWGGVLDWVGSMEDGGYH